MTEGGCRPDSSHRENAPIQALALRYGLDHSASVETAWLDEMARRRAAYGGPACARSVPLRLTRTEPKPHSGLPLANTARSLRTQPHAGKNMRRGLQPAEHSGNVDQDLWPASGNSSLMITGRHNTVSARLIDTRLTDRGHIGRRVHGGFHLQNPADSIRNIPRTYGCPHER
jgi:hypothetical protein